MSGGFNNPIIGGGGGLVYPSILSPDYVTGVSGWSIDKNGNAEFNNLVFRGSFNGDDFVITSAGMFFYSGTAAAGNLATSITNATGADGEGNAFLEGATSYIVSGGKAFAVAVNGGFIGFYEAATQAGPYSSLGSMGSSFASPSTFIIDGFTAIAGPIIAPAGGPSDLYPLSTITVAVPSSVAAWGANVDGVANATAQLVNYLYELVDAAGLIS
jgi:hypothetical protein